MIDSIQIQIFSITIILISALVYYFGVCWGHTQVENYNKSDCYFASILFIVKYMLPACALIIYLQVYLQANPTLFQDILNNTNVPKIIYMLLACSVILHLQTTSILFSEILNNLNFIYWIFILLVQVIFLGCISYLNKRYEKRNKSETYKDKQTFLYLDVIGGLLLWGKVEDKDRKGFDRRKRKMTEHLILLAISNLTVIIIYFFYNFDKLEFALLSAGIGFLTFTNIVFSVGHSEAYYPKAKIYLKKDLKNDDEGIEGNMLKYGEYICLLTDDKERLINRDDILYIEYI